MRVEARTLSFPLWGSSGSCSLDSGHASSRGQAETGGLGASGVLVSFRAALLTARETRVILMEAG